MSATTPLKYEAGIAKSFVSGDTVPIGNLPVGTTSGTVAAGDDPRFGGGGSGVALLKPYTYTSHGFVILTDINKPIYRSNTGVPGFASCVDSEHAQYIGLLSAVADANNFSVTQPGKYTWTGHGFADGATLFLSSSAGTLTATDSFPGGQVRKPIGIVQDVNTIDLQNNEGIIIPTTGTNQGGVSRIVPTATTLTIPDGCSLTVANYMDLVGSAILDLVGDAVLDIN